MPKHEMRRQQRLAAEKRNTLTKGSGQKLGGRPVPRSANIRNVITDAVQRRQTITQGCASGTRESEQIANEALRNGFKTQAEEDQANDRAIAEALWELAQQDQMNQETSDPNQWTSGGLQWDPRKGLDTPSSHKRTHSSVDQKSRGTWFAEGDAMNDEEHSKQSSSKPPPAVRRLNANFGSPRPDSDTLGDVVFPKPPQSASAKSKPKVYMPEKPPRRPPPIQEHPAFRNSSSSSNSSDHSAAPSVSSVTSSNRTMHSPHPSAFMSPIEGRAERHSVAAPTPLQTNIPQSPPPPVKLDTTWTCPACTLVNPGDYLCCEACSNAKPCHGTIVDFSSMTNLGPDAIPTQSPMSPAELPGSDDWRTSTSSSIRQDSSYFPNSRPTSRPSSLPPTSAALKTARSLAAATKTARPAQERRLGWRCTCGAFMEDIWWACSACGKMKLTS